MPNDVITARNKVCEGYVFTGICLSTGEGGLCPEDVSVTATPPPTRYGNVWAVRILLECILVLC